MKMHIGKWMTTLAIAVLCLSFTIGPKPEEIKQKRVTGDSLVMSTQELLKFCGEYLPTGPDPRMAKMRVVLRDGILYRHVNYTYVALNPVSPTKFIYDDNSGRSLEFVLDKKGLVKEVIVARPDGEFRLTRDAESVPVELSHYKYGISERIAELMKQYASMGQFNGTVLVARKGEIMYKEAFGKANIELGVANQMDTKYRLASLSKQFTAMLILQLADQRKLSLQVPIMYYLPDYPKEQGRKITIHHLLSHSSGIPEFTSFPDYESRLMKNKISPEALVKEFASLPLDFEPGTKFGYSNSGYVLLGYIIEKITGKSYEQNLQDNIFKPLKMYNSGYEHNETLLPKRAAGYDKKGGSYLNAEYIDMSVPYSAGAIYSTVDDLFSWDQALLAFKILPPFSQEPMFKNHHANVEVGYGYGWGIAPLESLREKKKWTLASHGGGINGFNSHISRVLEDNLLVVLLSNNTGMPLGEIDYAIRAICYDQPFDQPKRSLAYAIAERMQYDGAKSAMAQMPGMKSSGQYKIAENEMNELGYKLLSEQKYDDAIAVFKLNVEAFPYSGNCYDSLAEAYMKQGNKALAIQNYKKSIELDPKNENGKKMLEQLTK